MGQIAAGQDESDPVQLRMHQKQMKGLNDQRQKQLVADTDKLLQLAAELKAEVDKSGKDTLSITVIKKADEIEKLAKSVREKMKAVPLGLSESGANRWPRE